MRTVFHSPGIVPAEIDCEVASGTASSRSVSFFRTICEFLWPKFTAENLAAMAGYSLSTAFTELRRARPRNAESWPAVDLEIARRKAPPPRVVKRAAVRLVAVE